MLAARNQDSLLTVADTLKSISSSIRTLAISTDVSSETQVENLFKQAVEKFGRVDVVVHSAGVLGPVANIGDAPVDAWWQAFVSPAYPVA